MPYITGTLPRICAQVSRDGWCGIKITGHLFTELHVI